MGSLWKLFWWLSKGQSLKERLDTYVWFCGAWKSARMLGKKRTLQHLTEHGTNTLIVPLGKIGAALIAGGPYGQFQDYRVGICLAPEVIANTGLKYDWIVAWPDFGIPDEYEVKQALVQTCMHLKRRSPVYVGCMGGIGRTGTFLALLCKMGGEYFPVAYVRKHYLPHAVETQQQQTFIDDFDVEGL